MVDPVHEIGVLVAQAINSLTGPGQRASWDWRAAHEVEQDAICAEQPGIEATRAQRRAQVPDAGTSTPELPASLSLDIATHWASEVNWLMHAE